MQMRNARYEIMYDTLECRKRIELHVYKIEQKQKSEYSQPERHASVLHVSSRHRPPLCGHTHRGTFNSFCLYAPLLLSLLHWELLIYINPKQQSFMVGSTYIKPSML